ncbi:MAG: hypothetical protein JWO89_3583 [Verrucomicrobiaceae bacterium]|nr:hypothetical protein [Verrucomicrobiaceae bacterium]MDB6120222.1 hypothetical protein [Verrucomicrobiaceae bacterium]
MRMSSMTAPSPFKGLLSRLPGLLTGPGFIAIGAYILVKMAPPPGAVTYKIAFAVAGFGLLWSALSLLLPVGRWWNLLRWCSMNLLVLSSLVAVIEVTGRLAKINFAALGKKNAADPRQAYPIWAREPDQALPEVFFQHRGPAHWTGQPIRALELLRMGTDNAYVNEPQITVEYDADGFRNPPGLKDWNAVVVGDSYTELGYLPFDQIASSVAARDTGLQIKNLGVCSTGLLTYARYLRHFGAAPSCKRVVYVMFEGNDVQDTTGEYEALQRFELTGERAYKDLGPQTSFVKAVADIIHSQAKPTRPQSFQNAWFKAGDQELPVTVSNELPVNPQDMTTEQVAAMKAGITAMAAEARALHLEASLVYVPFNNRVYHGMLRFDNKLPQDVRDWQPHGLAGWIADLCKQENIAFLDAYPPLRAAAEQGHYVHNRILDCHVNAEGARIIGKVIASALKKQP